MRPLVVASFDEVPSFKGASVHVLAVCRGLRGSFDVRLVTLGELALPALPGFRHEPVVIREPNFLRRGERFRAHVEREIARERPALAHFRSPWEGLPIVRAGIPAVYEVNGLPSIELQETYRVPPSTLAVFARWERECVHGARAIVCPSERIARCVVERYGPLRAPVHVIPNGYDLVSEPDAAPPAGDALRLVYLGTLHPWQGLFVVLHALAELLGDGAGEPPVTLDVIAPVHRTFTRTFERLVERRGLGRVVRLLPPTHRGRLKALLPGYDAGLLPLTKSRRNVEQGCCPIKALDYLSHGLPIVASDLFVVRELVTHEHNGLLVPPNDARALADALRCLRRAPELREALRARARGSLAGRPDWDAHGARVRAIHERHASSEARAPSVRVRSSAAE